MERARSLPALRRLVLAPIGYCRAPGWPARITARRACAGNVVFPLTTLAVAIAILRKCMIDTAAKPVDCFEHLWRGSTTTWYVTPAAPLAATIFVAKLVVDGKGALERLPAVWAAIPAHCAMRVESLDPRVIFAPETDGGSPVNIVVLLALLTAAWCLVAGGFIWWESRSEAKMDVREA